MARVQADAEPLVPSAGVERARPAPRASGRSCPPAPAEFSIRSQVVSEQWSRICFIAGTTRSSPASKPAPWCEPTWKITPSASIARRGVHRRAHRRDALLVELVVRAGEVDEVERMDDDRADPELAPPLAERGEVGRVVVGEAPGARALDEELERIGSDLVRALERLLDPAGAVSAEEHGAYATRRAFVSLWPAGLLRSPSARTASSSRRRRSPRSATRSLGSRSRSPSST